MSRLPCGARLVVCALHSRSLVKRVKMTSNRHTTGLTVELDCAWCAPGKYQTGLGLIAEANCTSCVAGKYQSGSGLNAAFWLYLLMHTLEAWMHMRGDIAALWYTFAQERGQETRPQGQSQSQGKDRHRKVHN